MKKNILHTLIVFFTFFFSFTTSAQDSCSLRISLLTCSPGTELYSTFGHSALRVTNPESGQDVVFNYGTFNFEEPGFYTKFIRGKLLYYLSTEDFKDFAETYRLDNRSMIEQVLNLNCREKERIIALLKTNLQPENRAYKYDFLFDNCTTRLRDLVEKVSETPLTYPPLVEDGTRFRQLIHVYLNDNKQYWSKFGIDLLLGAKTDAVMKNRESMFLPDYLMMGFDSCKAGNKNLVSSRATIILAEKAEAGNNLLDQPLFVTSLLLGIILLLSFSRNKGLIFFLKNFDAMFFFLAGIFGIIILIMWFGTDHVMCKNNWNLLWALPSHAFACFFLNSKKKWVRTYLFTTILINAALLAAWFLIPQQLNTAIIPLMLLIMFRAGLNIKRSW